MGKGGARLEWKGKQVMDKLTAATAKGVDQTTAACVVEAKTNHEFVNRTSTLEGSIQMRPATIELTKVIGRWGSFSVHYAIFIEAGTSRHAPMPFLRPAADVEYPRLAERIKANMEAA